MTSLKLLHGNDEDLFGKHGKVAFILYCIAPDCATCSNPYFTRFAFLSWWDGRHKPLPLLHT